ncbi:hypothetical protein SAMN02745163_01625 [Clostridium cavendishii DSM 21758]|uniref:Uncharacterized protein n=1 Tax=Clostridium cavendishii DSM 21758 TaxID=1121302 RepID=A0A1M6HY37_9CLOT|nr:hypothetical protein [Clostridium cavendishii]SHJ27136.1 hypothetical protein SAMN02745163_01625 [Clostridium cavendishii DSM 21758]
MLKVSFAEFILRGIPETLVFFLAAYTFSKNIIQLKRYLLSSISYASLVYIIRTLPIQNGTVFILNLIGFIFILVGINKFDIIKSIKVSICVLLIEFLCEGINILVIQLVLKEDINKIFKSPMLKILYSMPALLLLGVVIILYYIKLKKRKELKHI